MQHEYAHKAVCCMSCKVKFSFEGGGSGGWETRSPLYAFSGSVPVNCSLQCLSNYLSHGEHTSSSVLTIAWKDSVKTTLGWYLTRLRVLAWLCRKEIATAVIYVWLMKGIFVLNPSASKDFLLFTVPWQGLFNPSVGFVISKRGSIFPITGFSFVKWSSFNAGVNVNPHPSSPTLGQGGYYWGKEGDLTEVASPRGWGIRK